MTRGEKLRKRVQKLKQIWLDAGEARDKLKKDPKVSDARKRAYTKSLIAAREAYLQSKAELATFRENAKKTPRQRLAEKILKSPRSRFVYVSPTGGSARGGLVATSQGKCAPVAATGGCVQINENLLRALSEMCDNGTILINCITNGSHSSGSNHYRGTAVDLDITSPLGATKIINIAGKYGGRRNFEQDHYHIDF